VHRVFRLLRQLTQLSFHTLYFPSIFPSQTLNLSGIQLYDAPFLKARSSPYYHQNAAPFCVLVCLGSTKCQVLSPGVQSFASIVRS
jgi:hypothetical protein